MKPSRLRSLTIQEQDFATKYHNLIYTYLRHRKLSVDDFYDIVIFGYLRAVIRYHDNKNLRRYSFTTIAWKGMGCAYSQYFRSLSANIRKANVGALSLDVPVGENDNCTLGDTLPVSKEIYAQLEYKEFFQETTVLFPLIKRKALLMKLDGYHNYEIKKAMKLSV